MGRPCGSAERDPKNKVAALKEWAAQKKRVASAAGCKRCQAAADEPKRLVWLPRDASKQEFRISAGPAMAGMTQERMADEIAKCDLVCRRCHSLSTMPLGAGVPQETLREQATVLQNFLGEAVTNALVATSPPALLLGDVLFVKSSR